MFELRDQDQEDDDETTTWNYLLWIEVVILLSISRFVVLLFTVTERVNKTINRLIILIVECTYDCLANGSKCLNVDAEAQWRHLK